MEDTFPKSCTTPYASTEGTRNETCQELRDSLNHRFITCSLPSWFETYPGVLKEGLPFGTKVMADLIGNVKARITDQLDESGWKKIREREWENLPADSVFAPLTDITTACGDVASKFDSGIVSQNELRSCRLTHPEMPYFLFKSNFQLLPKKNSVTAFVYGPDSKMKHCEEFRYSPHADIAAPDRATFVKQVAASAAIGEVKRNKSLANMND
ncbi:hypothetical protein C0991_008346, partial [Blastosporella zonata]